jgi:hypothetical protein
MPSYRTDWKAGKGSGALLLLSINPVWTVMWSGGALHHADSIECIKNLEVQVIPRLSGIPASYGFSSPSGQPAPDFFMPCNSRRAGKNGGWRSSNIVNRSLCELVKAVLPCCSSSQSLGYPTTRSRGGEGLGAAARARCRRSPSATPAAKIAVWSSVLRRRCRAFSDSAPPA